VTSATKRPARPRARRWWTLAAAGALLLVGLAGSGFVYTRNLIAEIAATLPPVPDIATLPVSTVVADRDGELLRPFTTDDGRWRLPVTLADVDRDFIDMLIAYEDRNFALHHGVDWHSMLRAAG
jgi:penicillin-binding protein 1C